MKIFIISLKNSPDRRENITKQLTPLNLDWQFFNAVNGRDKDFAFNSMQVDLYRTIFRSRPLAPGEKAAMQAIIYYGRSVSN